MTVKEFCQKYGAKYQTVYKRIKNHKTKTLYGHIFKEKGKSMELDEYAEEFLKGIPARINELEQECIQIAEQNEEYSDEIDRLNYLLRQKDTETDKLRSELTEQENKYLEEIHALENTLAKKESIIAEFREEIEKLHAGLDGKKGLKALFGSKN